MNVCACETKSSKESMRQNVQQHDTGIIDSLVLHMLLPLHCLHLLLVHWCCARRCCYHHIVYISDRSQGALNIWPARGKNRFSVGPQREWWEHDYFF